MRVLKESYAEAKRLLTEHRNTLDKIADFLIERETITGKEFMEIFHQAEGTSGETQSRSEARIQEKTVEQQEETVKTETENVNQAERESAKTDTAAGPEDQTEE